ncbi:alpha/beta hydrolase family protein [Streptomyces sp. NBC_00690]|uniref:alpha/beta hydrolase family protein n=1 Tax=Streptomyces sp. NBC_00690 TaxID=2975808 RepID=UPI002E2D55CF|nr:alpha/beta hydrolase [Streptomyces sp. NBC_00690]
MTSFRRGTVSALLALTLPLPLIGAASAAPATPSFPANTQPVPEPAPRLELPVPEGRYGVGTSSLHLTDTSRTDHWVPSSGAREVLVSMYYPARKGTGKPTARPYLTPEESQALLTKSSVGQMMPAGSAERVSATRTHARDRAVPVPGQRPLVVLSPGFELPRATMTALAEELASRGYVVASLDHAYESVAAAFPGKGVLPCVACVKMDGAERAEEWAVVPEGRSKDVSFVLDRLTGHQPVWKHSGMIDRKRIAMAGFSIGGNSAAQTMVDDRRVRAGFNLDGAFLAPVPESGLGGRPFMLLGEDQDQAKDQFWSWHRNWPRLDGWKRWITVTGSHHMTFTDAPTLADQIDGSPKLPGAPSGKRSTEIVRTYVTAFFDKHLRAKDRPVLDGPTPQNPEAIFHQN